MQQEMDFGPGRRAASKRRARGGMRAHLAGQAAEGQVERAYTAEGATLMARRWRSRRAEIDLVLREGDVVVFVEVKRAARHGWALERLSEAQVGRIAAAAEMFLEAEGLSPFTERRFDVATVDGAGRVEILRNALA